MRKVHPAEMVAHLWANQSQPTAYTARRNFYYDGSTIYSYGEHFPVAKHVEIGTGKHKRRCVLVNNASTTNTTNKHRGHVRDALRGLGLPAFNVPHLEPRALHGHGLSNDIHKHNLEDYQQCIAELAAKAKRARVNCDWLGTQCQAMVDEANAYAAFFKLRKRFKVPTDLDLADLAAKAKAEQERTKARRAKQDAERAKRQAARNAELATELEQWKRGERDSVPSDYWGDTLLRVRGSYIQTSRGAVVPVDEATKLLPLIRRGKAWHANGQTMAVGSFQLSEVTEQGDIRVGCHTIKRDELERIAAELGL